MVTRPSFADAVAAVADVDGWMTEGQARRLWDRAAALEPGSRMVEIGSFRGRSTTILALAAVDGAALVDNDPHDGTDRGPQKLQGFADEAAVHQDLFPAHLEPSA